jgi:hypothetical protein
VLILQPNFNPIMFKNLKLKIEFFILASLILGFNSAYGDDSTINEASLSTNQMISNPGFEDGPNPCWWWGDILLEDDFESGSFDKWDSDKNKEWDISASQYKSPNHAAHITDATIFYEDFENGFNWVVEDTLGGGAGIDAYYEENQWQRPLPPSRDHWCYLLSNITYGSAIHVNTGVAVEDGATYTLDYYTGSNNTGWSTSNLTAELWVGDPKDNNSVLLGSYQANIPATNKITFNIHEFFSGTGNSGNLFIRFNATKTTAGFEQPILDNIRLSFTDSDLISHALDTSQADAIRISFWYRDNNIDDEDDVRLQLYDDEGSYDDITLIYPKLELTFELGNTTPENKWHFCRINLYNEDDQAQYFHSNFRIKFEASGIGSGEDLWIDDVVVEASVLTETDALTGNHYARLEAEGTSCVYKGAGSWIPGKNYWLSVRAMASEMSGGKVELVFDNEVKGSIDSNTDGWQEFIFQHQYVPELLFNEDFESGLGNLGWVVEGTLWGGAGTDAYFEENSWQRPLPPSPDHWCYLQLDISHGSAIHVNTGILVENGNTYILEYITGSNNTGWGTSNLTAELWVGDPKDNNSVLLGSYQANRPATNKITFNSHEFSSSTGNSGNLFIRFNATKTAAGFEQPILDNIKLMSSKRKFSGNVLARYVGSGGTVLLDDWSIQEIHDEELTVTIYHGFSADANELRNPERGFRYEKSYWDGTPTNTDWSSEIPFGMSLALTYEVLASFADQDISQVRLNEIGAMLSNLLNYDMKSVLRVTYRFGERPSLPEPSLTQLLDHIVQLAPIITNASDVIDVWQVGLLGDWGEWHTISPSLDNWATKATIVDAILSIVKPINRKIMLRRPYYKYKVLDQLGVFEEVNAAKAHTNAPCALIGYHNDGFLANKSDGGTWLEDKPYHANPGNEYFDYMTRESPYVPVDGEMFYNENDVVGLDAAVRMRLHHYTTFSANHGWDYSIKKWREEEYVSTEQLCKMKMPISDGYFKNDAGEDVNRSVYDYIRDHLGYRIELQWATLPETIKINDTLSLEVNLINRGFAAFINPRPVFFVLISENGTVYEFEANDAEPRSWQPFKPDLVGVQVGEDFLPLLHKISIEKPLPDDILPGVYKLGLWLPDESSALRLNSKYAVRVANRDVEWNNGVNILGQIIIDELCPDTDSDGLCDASDPDDDNDNVDDVNDTAPLDPNVCRDLDGDTCDDCSSGVDNTTNDGTDNDGDGQCDAGDPDDDNDGLSDFEEIAVGTDPLNADTDGDTVIDGVDNCPLEDGTGFDADKDGCIDTLSGLSNIVETLTNKGVIAEELKISLLSKVESAEKSADKENTCAAINKLEALINQTNAQRDNKISEKAADLIVAYANNLIAEL